MSTGELADEYGVTDRQIRRVVAGAQHADLGSDAAPAGDGVADAVAGYFETVGGLAGADSVREAVVRMLAAKLDAVAAADSAAAAQAAPRIAAALADVLAAIEGSRDLEPDVIDEIRARAAERHAAMTNGKDD